MLSWVEASLVLLSLTLMCWLVCVDLGLLPTFAQTFLLCCSGVSFGGLVWPSLAAAPWGSSRGPSDVSSGHVGTHYLYVRCLHIPVPARYRALQLERSLFCGKVAGK